MMLGDVDRVARDVRALERRAHLGRARGDRLRDVSDRGRLRLRLWILRVEREPRRGRVAGRLAAMHQGSRADAQQDDPEDECPVLPEDSSGRVVEFQGSCPFLSPSGHPAPMLGECRSSDTALE
jgi:hypothetical protein